MDDDGMDVNRMDEDGMDNDGMDDDGMDGDHRRSSAFCSGASEYVFKPDSISSPTKFTF